MSAVRYPTRNITTARASLRKSVKDNAPYAARRQIAGRIYTLLRRRAAR